jgi:hypothetical protein
MCLEKEGTVKSTQRVLLCALCTPCVENESHLKYTIQEPMNQDSTDTNECTCLVSFEQPLLFLRQLKRGQNLASFFGTHLYLYCPGSVVPAQCNAITPNAERRLD